ncbi:hypothetical protein A4U53_005500 (plasmid) [Rhizobium ruizarguesonis]|uniref:Uncharacterized protein n=1 Tax=Rhizobium ruizarguesonis TaxID=2081791 RepID=A0ACD5EIG4_9HYPH
MGKGWNFALKAARHAHLVTVPACGGYQQRVHAMIEGCDKSPWLRTLSQQNTRRRDAFCYSGGVTTLPVSAPAF